MNAILDVKAAGVGMTLVRAEQIRDEVERGWTTGWRRRMRDGGVETQPRYTEYLGYSLPVVWDSAVRGGIGSATSRTSREGHGTRTATTSPQINHSPPHRLLTSRVQNSMRNRLVFTTSRGLDPTPNRPHPILEVPTPSHWIKVFNTETSRLSYALRTWRERLVTWMEQTTWTVRLPDSWPDRWTRDCETICWMRWFYFSRSPPLSSAGVGTGRGASSLGSRYHGGSSQL